MRTDIFYKLTSDHDSIPAGTIVQDTGYVQVFPESDEWNYWVQWTLDGQLHRYWLPKGKLEQIDKPDNWTIGGDE